MYRDSGHADDFFSEWNYGDAAPSRLELLRDVEYGKVGMRPLLLHVLRSVAHKQMPLPVLIGIHGGGWAGGSKDWCLETLLHFVHHGYFCASIGHRFQKEAPFPAMIEDCKCAVRYLRAHADFYGLDTERIGVWGFSSGGHLATLIETSAEARELKVDGGWAEYSSRVQAVCDWCGPADFSGWDRDANYEHFGGTIQEKQKAFWLFDPVNHLTAGTPPFLIMHGDQDALVPLSHSERLYHALTEAGSDATLCVVAGARHGFAHYDVTVEMLRFFDRHLRL